MYMIDDPFTAFSHMPGRHHHCLVEVVLLLRMAWSTTRMSVNTRVLRHWVASDETQ